MTFASFLPHVLYKRLSLAQIRRKADRIPASGLRSLMASKKGRSLLVLGNGPSLRGKLIDVVSGFPNAEKLCVNEFVHSGLFLQVRPEHYLFLDPGYWDRNAGPITDKLNREDARIIAEQTSWDMTIYLPEDACEWSYFQQIPHQNSHVQIVYYRKESPPDELKAASFDYYDRNVFAPKAYNVLVMALYLAIVARFDTVTVVGADHSWHKDVYLEPETRMLYWGNPHFYEGQEEAAKKKPLYLDTSETTLFTMAQLFRSFSHMFDSYEEMERYARSRGVKIFNATPGSFIDAFEFRLPATETES